MSLSKKMLFVSLVVMSFIFTALASNTMIANADSYGGIAQYWDGTQWKDIYPELPIVSGQTVKIRIQPLPAGFSTGDLIEFNIAESGWGNDYTSTSPFHPFILVHTDSSICWTGAIEWTSSVELEYCHTYTIKYRTNDNNPPGTWVAQGIVSNEGPWGGHFHVIPEFPIGSVMALLSSLSGLALFIIYKTR
jgi:hypothetical protein